MKYIVLYVLCATMTLLTACGPQNQGLAPEGNHSSGQQTGLETPEQEEPPSSAQSDRPQSGDQSKPIGEMPLVELEPATQPMPVTGTRQGEDPTALAYAEVLTRLLEEHTFPDSQTDDFDGELHSMKENQFAVADVDGDGRRELVIRFVAAELENQRGLVLDWDEAAGTVNIQLDENPGMVFFKNGAVLAQWASNPNKGGAFWPFSLYEYRPELDSYSYVGCVDAWDRSVYPDGYPDQSDRSGTGFVYYLLPDGPREDAEAVDTRDYEDWMQAYVGDGAMMELDYKDLTAENIGALNQEASREQAEAEAPAPG